MSQMLDADTVSGYVFDSDADHAAAQLRCVCAAYDPFSTERLAATGLGDGWRCLEIGAGPGSIANWLADRVAPTGRVLATDLHIGRLSERPGLAVQRHDIVHDPLPQGEFDLIHARLVLQHLPERRAVLARLLAALRPGGWLQIDEFDTSYAPVLLAPDTASAELYERFLAAKNRAIGAGGGRVVWGRECAADMREAGFTELDPQLRQFRMRAGDPALELQVSHTHNLRDRLLAEGLTDHQLTELRAIMRHPEFQAVSPVLYSVQGRRPA